MGKKNLPAVQSPHVLDFISHSTAQTVRIGQRLGEHMQPGDVVLLTGDLGVGKTRLVKGIAQGLNSPDLVSSPSFVLVNEYRSPWRSGSLWLYHVDLYRLDDPSELSTLGLDEIWDSEGICLVEWADRAMDDLPGAHLEISMQYLDETKRVLRFEPRGARYQQLVEDFKQSAFA